ncbi:hypothetical protein [Paramaledivibacter caminithermalis]|jgi:hypothetical protein|uniref:Uncharacterized protein n=1 Tax=Paramaledivibacter caminithermalis (strain DSM 15212 / CIP 107654 / DViRD3) TaxID=1121301 RepID=A0A1M6TGD9_PARC5|nr:hypothetical protein [Paramaledivibacter caminithermalis]SHK56030.1 hypothetical protein SAMN02745912_03678 [Paramaledivibacter caminithermalis DSM 15212]
MKNDNWVKILFAGAILMLISQIAKIPLLFAVSFPVVFATWMILGAIRKNQIGQGLKLSIVSLFAIWVIGFLAMNLMNHSVFTKTILAFMPGTSIMIYLIWLLPFFVGTLVYSLRFDKEYLAEEDIKAFQKLHKEAEQK